MIKSQTFIAWMCNRIALAFLSVFAGWGICLLFFLVTGLITLVTGSKDHLFLGDGDLLSWTSLIEGLFIIALATGPPFLFIWVFIWVPLTLLVPGKSSLWEPRYLTPCGIVAGPLLVVVFLLYSSGGVSSSAGGLELAQSFFCLIAPAIVGGFTCYVGARLNQRLLAQAP